MPIEVYKHSPVSLDQKATYSRFWNFTRDWTVKQKSWYFHDITAAFGVKVVKLSYRKKWKAIILAMINDRQQCVVCGFGITSDLLKLCDSLSLQICGLCLPVSIVDPSGYEVFPFQCARGLSVQLKSLVLHILGLIKSSLKPLEVCSILMVFISHPTLTHGSAKLKHASTATSRQTAGQAG